MKALGRYDTSIQMFVAEGQDLSPNHIAFQRWLIDHGRMDTDLEVDPEPLAPSYDPSEDGCLR